MTSGCEIYVGIGLITVCPAKALNLMYAFGDFQLRGVLLIAEVALFATFRSLCDQFLEHDVETLLLRR